MGVTEQDINIEYKGNGVVTSFFFDFRVLTAAEVQVILVSSTGVETVQTLTTHYTVDLNTTHGGTINMVTAPALGEFLFIQMNHTATQPVEIPFGKLQYQDIVDTVDKLALLRNQITGLLARAPKFASTTDYENVSMVEPEDGKGFYFDVDGNLVNTVADLADLETDAILGVTISAGVESAEKVLITEERGLMDLSLFGASRAITASETLSKYDRSIHVNATSAQVTVTLPTLSSGDAGRRILVSKSDASANAVVIESSQTMVDTYNSDSQFYLYKQGEVFEVEWDATRWIKRTVKLNHTLSDNYDDFAALDSSTMDSWTILSLGLNAPTVTLPKYSKWKIRVNGTIRVVTGTTDPVDTSLALSVGNTTGSGLIEKFSGNQLGTAGGDRFPFEFGLTETYEVGSADEEIWLQGRVNTVSGSPTLTSLSLYQSSGAIENPNDSGANIVAERVG